MPSITTPADVIVLVNRLKRPTRIDVAHAYADMLLSFWDDLGAMPSTHDLNNRIVQRWSLAGLRWIKQQAWKRAQADVTRSIRLRAEAAAHLGSR